MIESLTRYDWQTSTNRALPGTEDWVAVAEIFAGDYEWSEFNAYWSPSARRYFWYGDSGCSCNSWIEGVSNADSFQNGDREALLRAWKVFAEDISYHFSVSSYLSGAETIRAFSEEGL